MSKKDKDEDPKYVLDDVCNARMKGLEKEMKYLFASSLITIALIIIQLVRGA